MKTKRFSNSPCVLFSWPQLFGNTLLNFYILKLSAYFSYLLMLQFCSSQKKRNNSLKFNFDSILIFSRILGLTWLSAWSALIKRNSVHQECCVFCSMWMALSMSHRSLQLTIMLRYSALCWSFICIIGKEYL